MSETPGDATDETPDETPDGSRGTTPDPDDLPEVGLIADEQLPEDLQPAENPLARDPDDEADDGSGAGPDGGAGGEGGSGGPKVEGMPDMGEPGA